MLKSLFALALYLFTFTSEGGLFGVEATKPNIIFFLTDDVDIELNSMDFMPNTKALLSDRGATFKNMYASVPVCCPSRSSLYSGQYQHNNLAVNNSVNGNCAGERWVKTTEPIAFPVHLANSGYMTTFAGKYLNNYGNPLEPLTHVPPGWTDWHGLEGNSVYYNYRISENGVAVKHGSQYPDDYLPLVVANRTLTYVSKQLAAGTGPVFATLSFPAAHEPADPAPEYAGLYPNISAPRTPSFNFRAAGTHWLERVQAVYGLNVDSIGWLDLLYRRRLQTLRTVDDIVKQTVDIITAAGQLDNTFFVFTADNGYHLGQFGLAIDKRQPWLTDSHLPLIISGPGVPQGVVLDDVVSMVDLGPTFLDAAGAKIPDTFDGQSLLPLLHGKQSTGWRTSNLIEYHGESQSPGPAAVCSRTQGDMGISCDQRVNFTTPPYFFGNPFCTCQDAANNTYSCLRIRNATADLRYCEFAEGGSGLTELFNYTADPSELYNIAKSVSVSMLAQLHAQLTRAVSCVGAAACSQALA